MAGIKTAAQLQAEADAQAQVLAQLQGSAPGSYNSAYGAQIDALTQQLNERKPFTYDANGDPLYRQYSERYQQQGRAAMADTLGAAAALTGGYGSSYGTTAASQAYQQYLSGLNDVLPTLYEAAYGRYQDTGEALKSRLSELQGRESTAYNAYRDQVGDYQTKLNDAQSYWRYLNDAAYQAQQDEQAQSNWAMEFGAKYPPVAAGGGGGSSRSKTTNAAKTTTVVVVKPSAAKATAAKTGSAKVLRGSGSSSTSLTKLRQTAK